MSTNTYNYRLNHRVKERHEHILNMYLDGATRSEMLDYLNPDRKTKHQGATLLDDIMRTLAISLRMPNDKKSCIRNKDTILNNLSLIKKYYAEYDRFIAKKESELLENGFINLADL